MAWPSGSGVVYFKQSEETPRSLMTPLRHYWHALRSHMRSHWIHVPFQMFVFISCTFWLWHIPAPNKAVLILTGVTIAMALIDMRPSHKAIYAFLAIWLMFIENRAIDHDRLVNQQAEESRAKLEHNEFKRIADGLQTSISQSDAHFQNTMKATDKLIADSTELARLSRENIDAITGGKTFCYAIASADMGNYVITILAVGSSPLHDVSISMFDRDEMTKMIGDRKTLSIEEPQRLTMSFPPVPSLSSLIAQMLVKIPMGPTGKRNLQFNFFSINGGWSEALNLRIVSGQVVQAFRVTKMSLVNGKWIQKTLKSDIPANYPKVNGKMDW